MYLNCKGNLVAQRVDTVQKTFEDGGGEKLPDSPAKIDVGGKIAPKSQRRDFCSICWAL